jgi:hypothetical protein
VFLTYIFLVSKNNYKVWSRGDGGMGSSDNGDKKTIELLVRLYTYIRKGKFKPSFRRKRDYF